MSITSERIREQGFFHALADDAADEIEQLEAENAAQLAELTAHKEVLRLTAVVLEDAVEEINRLACRDNSCDESVDVTEFLGALASIKALEGKV